MTAIHKDTFRNNLVITKIIWPQELPQIPKECFWGCSNLKEVEFPTKVELSIADKAFYNCRNLKSVRIPANVTQIGENAFGYAQLHTSGLWIKRQCTDFIYGISDTAAAEYAEKNDIIFIDGALSEKEQQRIKTMTFHEVADGISLDRLTVDGDEMIIPESIDGKPVVELSENFNKDKTAVVLDMEYFPLAKKVVLPKFLKCIACPLNGRNIEHLEIHADNHEIVIDEVAWYGESGRFLGGLWKNSDSE